jgi:TatD DNase family protein
MWIDSHCHLDRYDDLSAVIDRALTAGIHTMLSICTSYTNFSQVLSIAESYPFVYASVGIHPSEIDCMALSDVYPWLIECAQHPKVIAIGETGLDDTYPNSIEQENVFRAHIRAAQTVRLPLVVHMRQAEKRLIEIIQNFSPIPRGVLHCFTSSLHCAQQVIPWNWKISFSGILTFGKAQELREVAKELPIDSICLETDAPWLAPTPYRGKRNEPAYIIETAQCLADTRQQPLETIAAQTCKNFFDLFDKARSTI